MVYLPHWPIPATLAGRKIDFETVFDRITPILEKLGNPHLKLPPVIYVTGTNGKGSTVAFLAAFFQAAGYKAHIYTSPHLHHCNERIVLANEKISDNFLFEVMEETRIAAGEASVTFFEGFTIGAFLAFTKVVADVCIVEVGMGGRIDATNIVKNKLVNIITPISFDHTEYLGNEIEKIALEKALIIRENVPVIVGPQPKQALEIIKIIANDCDAKVIHFDKDFQIFLNEDNSFNYQYFSKNVSTSYENLPSSALRGQHQYINSSVAIAAINAISEFYPNLFKIDQSHINKGLQAVKWPSRLERIESNLDKLLKNDLSELILDGAHNQGGAYALARWLTEKAEEDEDAGIARRNFLIVGFSRGKCKKEFLANFLGVVDKICAIRVAGEPYPESAEVIVEVAKVIDLEIEPCADLISAITYLVKLSEDTPCRIVICGSLHLARDVKMSEKEVMPLPISIM